MLKKVPRHLLRNEVLYGRENKKSDYIMCLSSMMDVHLWSLKVLCIVNQSDGHSYFISMYIWYCH